MNTTSAVPDLWDIEGLLAEVHAELARRKLPLPAAPREEAPPIPDDITSISGERLMELMVTYEGLGAYADSVAAEAALAADALTNRLNTRKAELTLELRDEKRNGRHILNEDIPALITTHPDMRELRHEQLKTEAFRDMARVLTKGYANRYALLSRALSRRTQRGERE